MNEEDWEFCENLVDSHPLEEVNGTCLMLAAFGYTYTCRRLIDLSL